MENLFLTVDEVRQLLGVSKSYAYKVIRKMNSELRQQGYHTIAGRVSKTYFLEKVKYQKLDSKEKIETSEEIKKRVDKARKIQLERYKDKKIFSNNKIRN